MPSFTYTGPARTLVLAGTRLNRGVPAELTGRAAEAAAAHPDVVKGAPKKADQAPSPNPALVDIAAYLESGATDVGELTTKLVKLDAATLAELAKEYDLDVEIVEEVVAGPELTALAEAMLADGDSTPQAPTVEELMKLNREQLNAQASEAGVEKPEEMANKREVAAALLAAYGSGEGS